MNRELQTVTMSMPIGSLDAYVHRVNAIPMLTVEEEQELANRFRQYGDLDAARQLVLSHLRFVVRVARNYTGYGLPQADLIQEGNVGLMKAVKRFDPAVGVRLVSFAVHWIKAEIHEFVLRNWKIVKVATTKAQRKLFFNLRKMSKRLGWFSKQEIEDVANELNVTPQDVVTMENRLNNKDESFDGAVNCDDGDNWSAPAERLADNRYNPAVLVENHNTSTNKEHLLQTALASLDERSKDILQRRWLADKKSTLHELSAQYNVSAERIRQIEQQAMSKIKESMLHADAN